MINKLWIINKDDWKDISRLTATLREFKGIFSDLRNEGYDMAIDLQGLLRSGLLTMASSSALRIGFKDAREGGRFFYTHRVETGKDMHAVDRYLRIAEAVGCDISNIIFPMPLIKDSDIEDIRWIKDELREYAVIAPGGRWQTKRWDAESFGRLASHLPLKTIVVGSKADEPASERIVGLSKGNAISLAGKTDIRQLIGIMRHAKFVVSNDSGAMHIAAALGVPVIAIFGPTSPQRTGPYGRGHIAIRSDIDCSPCFKKKCVKLDCMKGITVERVLSEVRRIEDL